MLTTEDNQNKIWTILGFIVFCLVLFFLVKNLHDIDFLIRRGGLVGPLIAIGLYTLFAATPVTTDPLTIICGVVFGPFFGILISWLGNNAAALVEYYLGRHITKITNFKKNKKKLPFGLDKLPMDSPIVLIFGRMIPGYGGKIISIMAGVYHVPLKKYVWTTAITNILGSLLLAFGGYHLASFLKHSLLLLH